MEYETQCKMVLTHLQAGFGITDEEAREKYGIHRLSGRIYDLRNAGHKILSVDRKCINRYGRKVRFVEYRLVKE